MSTADFQSAARGLNYRQPAANFNEALPLGNGTLGAMPFGHPTCERIHLNHDRLWAGRHAPQPDPEAPGHLSEVRRLLFAGEYAEAHRHAARHLLTAYNQPYLPAGDLLIRAVPPPAGGDPDHYHRSLDFAEGLHRTSASWGDVREERLCYCSFPDRVFVLEATRTGSFWDEVLFQLESPLRHRIESGNGDVLLLGEAPLDVPWPGVEPSLGPGEGVRYAEPPETPPRVFAIRLRVCTDDGELSATPDGLRLNGSSAWRAWISIHCAGTPEEAAGVTAKTLDSAGMHSPAALLARHRRDHNSLQGRVSLRLDGTPAEICALPTDKRLRRRAAGAHDPALEALLFDYGRYLLIASSRPNSQPANLMGIWNPHLQPPWWSNYTLNINTQMNYWPAEVCALPECHEPLFDLIDDLRRSGGETARIHYACRGWCAHHQTDFLRQTTPVGASPNGVHEMAPSYALWPLAGVWLCRHLWEHFLHSGDTQFLRERAWPAIRGAAEFLLDWWIPDPRTGEPVTAPSTSPENCFCPPDGEISAVGTSSAMDISLSRELLETARECLQLLGTNEDTELRHRIDFLLQDLPPLSLDGNGGIREISEDWPDAEPPHRHLSQLYGLFPGTEIPSHQPDATLHEAAVKTLAERGDAGTGWSLAWKICLRARLGQGDHAHRLLGQLFQPVDSACFETANDGGGLYPNLLAACPPMMVEANFGATAGIAEMLVQSHRPGIVDLLPALPSAWPQGAFFGLRLRGGLTLDLAWQDHRPDKIRLHSQKEIRITLSWQNHSLPLRLRENETLCLQPFPFSETADSPI